MRNNRLLQDRGTAGADLNLTHISQFLHGRNICNGSILLLRQSGDFIFHFFIAVFGDKYFGGMVFVQCSDRLLETCMQLCLLGFTDHCFFTLPKLKMRLSHLFCRISRQSTKLYKKNQGLSRVFGIKIKKTAFLYSLNTKRCF